VVHEVSLRNGRKLLYLAFIHFLPESIIFKLKDCRDYSIIRLNVGVKSMLVEDASDCSVEPVDSRISERELLPSEALPECHH
jgi:hypothetical protein